MEQQLHDFWKSAPDDPFDAFFQLAPIYMHSIDAAGVLLKVSPAWARALGYDPAEMIGRASTDFLTEESRRQAIDHVVPAFLRTGQVDHVEYDFLRKDGSILPVVLSASSILDGDGAFVRSLAIIFDNSAAKRAEAELRAALTHAEEASRAKSRFLAAMSHEIRTPMNAILGFAQLLQRSDLDEKRQSHVASILRAGGSLMALLNDLLDLSQIEEGRMRVEHRPFELRELIEQAADWWQARAGEQGLRFSTILDRGLPDRVISDPVRLQQVLGNFLANAVKFTDEGRVTLAVEERVRDAERVRVRFVVSDTGPGMQPEQIDKLFQPFVQVDADDEVHRDGWGLGLSICYNIARAMGGEVGVTSAPGEGSDFHFELDLEIADRPAAPATPVAQAPKTRSLSILLAEDNAANQAVMREMLDAMGHRVEVVETGLDAVNAVAAGGFDVVLLDVMLPELDGVEAARRIRAAEDGTRHLPLIACTAQVSADARERYLRIGMDAVVAKPVATADLERAIAAVCKVQP